MDPVRFDRLEAVALARVSDAEPAHDALHVRRVMANARYIATAEQANVDIAVTAALLHELFNYPKDHPESARSGEVCAEHAMALLAEHGFDADFRERVAYCIAVHPFSRGITPVTREGRVLQDADRLDAIGAIGIARCFATCAAMGRPFYNLDDPFCAQRAPDDKAWGLDHFYRKLLKLPEVLHTEAARAVARERIGVMEQFLAQLGREIA